MTSTIYNQAFHDMIRGKKRIDPIALKEGYDEGSDSYMIPVGFNKDYTTALEKENLFRRYGTVVKAPTRDGYIQTVVSTADAKITAENMAFPEDGDTFNKISFSSYKLAVLSKLNSTFIADMNFPVEAYLNNEFARRFGRAEENIFINGTGVNEPTGLLQTAEIGKSTSATDISFDDIVALYLSVKPEYRKNSVWIMNDETALALRSVKAADGNYIWRNSDDTIFGRPVISTPYMPNIGTEAKTIAFGDLSYYWIMERRPLSVKVLRERYAIEGLVGFAAHEHLDGKLIRPELSKLCIKLIQTDYFFKTCSCFIFFCV